ncbi:MAG: hypothetical protein AABW46_03175 [Nanoarchaeota archaeon]
MDDIGRNGLVIAAKALGHIAYGVVSGAFVLASLVYGTPNVLKWLEIENERKTNIQTRNSLYDLATQLADRDSIEGLSLFELGDLYQRAGVNPKITPKGEIQLPELTTENLEGAIQSYGSENKQ